MPEGYIHAHVADVATVKSGINVEAMPAYMWGAQGPDPFSIYKLFGKGSSDAVRQLSGTMHIKYTGEFIAELLSRADTPIKRSYVKGFLTHYIADIVIHPYVESQVREGGRFFMAHGHGFCETSMDSYVHLLKRGTARVDGRYVSPRLSSQQISELSGLLSPSIKAVYGVDIGEDDIKKAFSSVGFFRRHILSGGAITKWICTKIEKHIIKDNGAIICHLTPGQQPRHGYISEWTNPFTGEECHKSPLELVDEAVQKSSAMLIRLQKCFSGKLTKEQFLEEIGSLNYITGLPWRDDMKVGMDSV